MTPVTAVPPIAYEAKIQLKPAGLNGFTEKLLDQHWKLYLGYVTNTNALTKLIAEAANAGEALNKPQFAEYQRRLGFEVNGMVLHEYYFGALKSGGTAAPAAVTQKLAQDFGSFDAWKKQFTEIGLMRGIGWVIANYDPSTKRVVNTWVADHEIGNLAGFVPLVVMDVWEHAYVLDYGATADGRTAYIQAYFNNLDWSVISKRFDDALAGKLSPR